MAMLQQPQGDGQQPRALTPEEEAEYNDMLKEMMAPPPGVADDDASMNGVFNNMSPYAAYFGPEYFRGVMWGAGLSNISLMMMARRTFRRARRSCPPHLTLYQHDVWACAMFTCCACTCVMKTAKFFLSRYKYHEFLWEEAYLAEQLEQGTDEAAKLLMLEATREYVKSIEELQGIKPVVPDLAKQPPGKPIGGFGSPEVGKWHEKIKQTSPGILPTFYDGVSVGVFGKVQDAFDPRGHPATYLNLAAGGRMF